MNVDYNYTAKYNINKNPVLDIRMVDLSININDDDLLILFPNNKSCLRTWEIV